jgi:hypothetical protein
MLCSSYSGRSAVSQCYSVSTGYRLQYRFRLALSLFCSTSDFFTEFNGYFSIAIIYNNNDIVAASFTIRINWLGVYELSGVGVELSCLVLCFCFSCRFRFSQQCEKRSRERVRLQSANQAVLVDQIRCPCCHCCYRRQVRGYRK